MNKRKLLIGLTTAGLFMAGFGAAVLPASADPHDVVVTLVGGQSMHVTVDAPPGATPTKEDVAKALNVDPGQIESISDVTSPPADTSPTTETTPAPTTTTDTTPQQQPQPQQPAPVTEPQDGSASTTPQVTAPSTSVAPAAGVAKQQKTTSRPGKPQASVEGSKKGKKKKSDKKDKKKNKQSAKKSQPAPPRAPGGVPTPADPTFSLALPGPAPVGVPNFFIDKFSVPPFLLPIYQAAGIQYGVRWEILAAINEIETDYGRNLNVSTAGAVGWMQFLPSTWKRWAVDGNNDRHKDPYNPVDAIFTAARYLKAAGAGQDVSKAIFAYNHANWYVDSVLMRAQLLGSLPADLVGSLTGLTQGHFPVHAKARYADDVAESAAQHRVAPGQNAAVPVDSKPTRTGIDIYAKAGSPVIAVQDGKITRIGHSKRLGRFLMLQDVYGNTYTYGHLKKIMPLYPVPKPVKVSKSQVRRELKLSKPDPKPTAPASAGVQRTAAAPRAAKRVEATAPAAASAAQASPPMMKERLFAHPNRPKSRAAGGNQQAHQALLNAGQAIPGYTTFKSYFTQVYGLKRSDVELKPLKVGSNVIAGTILGRIGKTSPKQAPHVLFEIRPAGRNAPRIDPKPILDGWKLLESTAIYRAAGKNPFIGADAKNPSIGQILLMSKESLQRQVLIDSRVKIYECGRRDIRGGLIDRRVLATLEFLAASGLDPTVSALECGHSYYTSSGNVSEHSSGNAVDIAAINGIPIVGHQGPGSITDITISRLLTLQGTLKPHQIISLMTFQGADNTLALPDHYDHIHVGFQPLFGSNPKLSQQLNSVLQPGQWLKLMDRLGQIPNPTVPLAPSKFSIDVKAPAGVQVNAGD